MLREGEMIQAEEVWMDGTLLTLLLVAQLRRLDLVLCILTCFLYISTKDSATKLANRLVQISLWAPRAPHFPSLSWSFSAKRCSDSDANYSCTVFVWSSALLWH